MNQKNLICWQAVIDLILPGTISGSKETLVDLYGKPEILFFGPDEGTADLMDWAASAFSFPSSPSLPFTDG